MKLKDTLSALAVFLVLAPADQNAGYNQQHQQNFANAKTHLVKYITPAHAASAYKTAVDEGNAYKLQLLKNAGLSFGRPSLHAPTLLHDAVKEGNMAKVRFVLENNIPGATINDIQKANSWAQTFLDLVQMFNPIAWIRGSAPYGETALQQAVNAGRNDIAAYLLSQGADPTIVPANGRTVQQMMQDSGVSIQQFQQQHLAAAAPQQQPQQQQFAPQQYAQQQPGVLFGAYAHQPFAGMQQQQTF